MIYRLYGFKNRLLGSFESPVASNLEGKDYIEGLSMSLISSEIGVLVRYKEFDVYCLGEMDSKSGEILSKCDFVESLEPICVRLIEHKEKGADHGREEVKKVD